MKIKRKIICIIIVLLGILYVKSAWAAGSYVRVYDGILKTNTSVQPIELYTAIDMITDNNDKYNYYKIPITNNTNNIFSHKLEISSVYEQKYSILNNNLLMPLSQYYIREFN